MAFFKQQHQPIVVQGHSVAAAPYATPYDHHVPPHDVPSKSSSRRSGGGGCRDAFWGFLFYVHLGVMGYLAVMYGPQVADSSMNGDQGNVRFLQQQFHPRRMFIRRLDDAATADNDDVADIDVITLMTLMGVAGALGTLFSTLSLSFLMKFAEGLIKAALWFNILVFAAAWILALLAGALPAAILGGVMCVMAAYYTYSIWSRIPFAAANLVTAVSAVRSNMGLVFYAYLSLILLFGWTIWWMISAFSTIYVVAECDADGVCANEVNGGLFFLLLVSYYWTIQVITNVVHVTTAGTVGTWWFAPTEANGCCSNAVRDSYVRSLTTSFGSICLGSLVVALIQALREIVRSMRENGDSIVACCAECLIGCIESLVEYFNKWAFVYVGLYGMNFMEAGSSVMTLFRNRGWTSIITDLMVDTVLTMVSFGVGALTAILTLVIGATMNSGDSWTLGSSALLGFFIGYGMSAILFSVVSSAVNTVVVCYAEAPNEFQANHPELSNKMRNAWRQAWPNDFGY